MAETTETTPDEDRLTALVASVPENLRPWVLEYGPGLVLMTAGELKAVTEKLLRGDVMPAYRAVLAKMPNAARAAERQKVIDNLTVLNVKNAESMKFQRAAADALGRILLAVLMAAAGF